MSRGATEALVAKLADYEGSDLPERTKAALRLADRLASASPSIDPAFHEELKRHLTDDEILDLGMTVTFVSGWQRFIEAFGIVPDHWHDDSPPPFGSEGASPPSDAPRASPAPLPPPEQDCAGGARARLTPEK